MNITGITTTYEYGDDGQISRLTTTRSSDRSRACTFLEYHYHYHYHYHYR